jgi:chromate transporter
MSGANAAVVGILLAALYDPVFTTAITGAGPFVLALVGFLLLTQWKLAPWMVVVISAIGGIALEYLLF